jgi:rod shape-determining protein MreD
MGDQASRQLWIHRGLYILLAMMIVSYKLMPLGFSSALFPAPDLLLALTFAWLVRQPDVVPVAFIVSVFLLADFLFLRPPGLWTVLVLLGTETIRRRRAQMTEMPFLLECATFAVMVFALLVINRIVHWGLLLDQSTLGLTLTHGIVTVLCYPIIVALSKFAFGLHRLRPTESEIN